MHALLIGATGATGKDLLEQLLQDQGFERIGIFVRRDPGIRHAKLTVHVVDFERPMEWRQLVSGDVLFSCLGTTLKTAGNKKAQWKIDHDYQYAFAEAARKNNIPCYVLVSAAGAAASSPIFYSRMKGQLEAGVKALGFPRLAIFNPPLLIRKGTNRKAEVIARKVLDFFNGLGLWESQRPLDTAVLASAMRATAKAQTPGVFHYDGKAAALLAKG